MYHIKGRLVITTNEHKMQGAGILLTSPQMHIYWNASHKVTMTLFSNQIIGFLITLLFLSKNNTQRKATREIRPTKALFNPPAIPYLLSLLSCTTKLNLSHCFIPYHIPPHAPSISLWKSWNISFANSGASPLVANLSGCHMALSFFSHATE